MCWIEEWLYDKSNTTVVTQSVTTSFVQWLPLDPMRWSVSFLAPNSSVLSWIFGDNAAGGTQFVSNNQQNVISLTRRDIGDLICRPLWLKAASSTPGYSMVALSYLPERKHRYDEWVNKQLSRLDSP